MRDSSQVLWKSVEEKILEIKNKNTSLIGQLNDLKLKIQELENQNEKLKTNLAKLENENKELQISQALSGNAEYKKVMKLKINQLLKEVDQCIAQIQTQSI